MINAFSGTFSWTLPITRDENDSDQGKQKKIVDARWSRGCEVQLSSYLGLTGSGGLCRMSSPAEFRNRPPLHMESAMDEQREGRRCICYLLRIGRVSVMGNSLYTSARWWRGGGEVVAVTNSVSRDGNSCRPRNSPKPLFRSSPYIGMYGKVFRLFLLSFLFYRPRRQYRGS
jgi:hypothetical protein